MQKCTFIYTVFIFIHSHLNPLMSIRKIGVCQDCHDNVPRETIAGRCTRHYWAHRKRLYNEKLNHRMKVEISGAKLTMNFWYAARIKELSGFCQECGTRLPLHNPRYARACVAHILPKRDNLFPSVKSHPLNYIELGPFCGCHGKYDKSWDDAIKMRVWPLAVERFKQFMHLIASKELRNLPAELYNLIQ